MLWKRVVVALLVFFSVVASACYCPAAQKVEIPVSAAISLKEAFVEIASLYEKQTRIRARFNFGGSGLLQKQIEMGAPVDVFASAGEKQMDDLQSQGLIVPETRRDFAGNALVLIVPVHPKIALKSFADLAQPEIGRVAIGSPNAVPAGQYAEEALRNLKLWDALQPRLVLAENVRQVLDYVTRGEVDAGIVYASDRAEVHGQAAIAAQAPKGSHSPIRYPIAVVKQAGKGESKGKESQRFIELVLSGTGQAILEKYGFLGS
jgi:molybdate transport system substrate-binding protein